MRPQSPPVTWPSCSWTTTWSSALQPWPPTLVGKLPPWGFAAIAPRLTPRPPPSGGAPRAPPERERERLEDVPGERAGACLELELPVAERHVHGGSVAPGG